MRSIFSYSDGETEFIGQLVRPAAAQPSPQPAVLVFHEAWGLTDHIVEIAEWLAAAGVTVLACDMYGGGFVTDEKAVAGQLIGDLRADPGLMRKRANAALDAVKLLPGVDIGRIAALGYCFGGTVALELARDGAALTATICVHGGLTTQRPAEPGAVGAPILGCTGSSDPIVPLTQLADFATEMDRACASWRALVLGGARHSFTNPRSEAAGVPGAAYNAAADVEARTAILDFFESRMKLA